MKTPEQIPFDFEAGALDDAVAVGPTAQVIPFAELEARREAASIAAAYESIRQSIAHIDVTRARRLALAREQG